MNKAAFSSITKQLDTGLLADIERHDRAWSLWDQIFAESGEDDPRIESLCDECTGLAKRIVLTPAHTPEGRDGKIRVIDREEMESRDDDLGLIAMILHLDAERIAAAG
jgi:hypothetical protein